MNPRFNRSQIRPLPLSERVNKIRIADEAVDVTSFPTKLSEDAARAVLDAAADIRSAAENGRAVILAFGAHAIKNGLTPVLTSMMEHELITHYATNGAGIIHDWEFAFQGESGEDVELYTSRGQFGVWEETGLYLNTAIAVGAYRGLGYGESVGAFVENDGLRIPDADRLREDIRRGADRDAGPADLQRAAAAADLLELMAAVGLRPGRLTVKHPHKVYGLQAAAYRRKVPLTAHPMIGHDIIYTHPANRCAAVGRSAERDFLSFVNAVSKLDGGVYLSVGSAIMSPMIFEKALSMARNAAHQNGRRIQDFSLYVVDLAQPTWDWAKDGEPPTDNPAYYLRFLKTFSRMGGTMTYVGADNRSFLVELFRLLVPNQSNRPDANANAP